ncbi:MAG: sigma-70 family RNA polymerase sigma factor [Flavobacteriales bacterium]|nr:sigma-70 family RNA polymerase sigma factor [Flavobacteriales bacterium]
MNATEELAILEAAKRDPARFAPLYEHYFNDLFRFVHRRAQDRELSSDITQQAFLKAMLALPRYEPRGLPVRAWLFRIALNELRMHWRKRKEVLIDMSYREVKGLAMEVGSPDKEDELHRLARAMDRLDEQKARLIQLRYMDGLNYAEVGHVLGIGEDAAKMRTHRVLAVLRTYLSPGV